MATLPIVKEAAGFFGTVGVAVPWLRDFVARSRRDLTQAIPARGSLEDLLRDLREKDERWLGRAKASDLAWTIAGLSLIAASFLIGIYQAIAP